MGAKILHLVDQQQQEQQQTRFETMNNNQDQKQTHSRDIKDQSHLIAETLEGTVLLVSQLVEGNQRAIASFNNEFTEHAYKRSCCW